MVVEVSPCTMATSCGRCRLTASSMRWGSNTVPHSVSMATTSVRASARDLAQQVPEPGPKTGTSTRSPGTSTDARIASIPARAVPSTSSVHRLVVRNTCR